MEIILLVILAVLAAAGIGVATWQIIKNRVDGTRLEDASQQARVVIDQAEEEKRKLLLAANEEVHKTRAAAEREIQEQRQEVTRLEERFLRREEQVDQRAQRLEQQQQVLLEKETEVQKSLADAAEAKVKQLQALEEIAGLTVNDAHQLVLKQGEEEAQHDLARRYYDLEREFKERADENARRIVTLAINRLATDVVSEITTSVVPLPSDEMKGRLIGREGRNIRTLESLTGVDVIVDDTPEVVTISCFDPVRREVAKLALEKLVADGRIQPARIEEMVNRAQEDVNQIIWKAGEQATFDVGVSGLDQDLIRLLGQLKFRYSYGENVLKHSMEVALLSGMLAAEAGANEQVAKLGGLLHDIGKAVTHEVPGPHAEIGAEIA